MMIEEMLVKLWGYWDYGVGFFFRLMEKGVRG